MAVSGDKIRKAREALKERTGGRQGSQAWLAQQVGAHPTSVSDWERGANQPTVRHLRNIAAVLGVSVESLMDDDDEEDAQLPHVRDNLAVALGAFVDAAVAKALVRA